MGPGVGTLLGNTFWGDPVFGVCVWVLIVSSHHPSPCTPVQENPSYKGDASDPKAAGPVRSGARGIGELRGVGGWER